MNKCHFIEWHSLFRVFSKVVPLHCWLLFENNCLSWRVRTWLSMHRRTWFHRYCPHVARKFCGRRWLLFCASGARLGKEDAVLAQEIPLSVPRRRKEHRTVYYRGNLQCSTKQKEDEFICALELLHADQVFGHYNHDLATCFKTASVPFVWSKCARYEHCFSTLPISNYRPLGYSVCGQVISIQALMKVSITLIWYISISLE